MMDIPEKYSTPCLVIDVQKVKDNYKRLVDLQIGEVFYAMKANSGQHVLDALADLGSSFDCASMGEINTILNMGVSPDRISFGNTIKKERDIALAYEKGISLFVLDSDEELEKLSRENNMLRLEVEKLHIRVDSLQTQIKSPQGSFQ